MPIASGELSAVIRDDHVVLFVDGVAQLGLRPNEVVDELVRRSTRPEGLNESAKALAGLIVAAREPVADGSVALYWRGDKVLWQSALNNAEQDSIKVAAQQFVVAADPNPNSQTKFASAIRFAHHVADAYAAELSVPAAFQACDLSHRAGNALNEWAQRSIARERCGGARLVLTLDPPDAASDGGTDWIVTVGIAEGGKDIVHPLGSALGVRLDSSDQRDVDVLIRRELAAAKAVSKTAGLMTRFHAVISGKKLVTFIDSIDNFVATGIEVRAPKGLLRAASKARTQVSVAGSPGGMVSRELSLTVVVDVDGRELTDDELQSLARASEPFVKLGSEWIAVPTGVAAAARLFERAQRGPLDAVELLDEEFDGFDINAADVGGWVGDALRGVAVLSVVGPVSVPAGLNATLRHYQEAGLAWLTWCEENNVGGILADDMGLGKTIQLLARIEADHRAPTLVVAPTSLLENWRREAAKFTPNLRVGIHHGTSRDLSTVADCDIILTTYALLVKDVGLREMSWHRVVLDEAQAIKNPTSKAAQAVRKLNATHRFAVTGTPVENHLGDLWSLMAFAQPGLLGSFAKFRRRYLTGSVADDADRLTRLRSVVSPFMIRRTKKDKSVAPDLPPKIELRRDCGMTREQIGLYEAVVRKLESDADDNEGASRRGLILAGLTKLKQACVHPQLATGSLAGGLTSTSGKLSELTALLTEAIDEGDAVIVFTQYASFLKPLARYLKATAQIDALALQGSMSPAARTRTVDSFSNPDGPPVLLASLKAGGTGLNLVRARHVVHLDRWWNPAVEDQASDRAWRIGQTETVMVHTLVCPGTVEDRIDKLLRGKRKTAESIVAPEPVPAVTELTAEDLHELVALVREEQFMLRSS